MCSRSRKHFSDNRRQECYHLFRQTSRELRRTRRLGNVSGWRTSFRRTIFVVQTKILYCGPTIMQSFFLAPKIITIIKKFFLLKIKPKMRDAPKEKGGNTSKCWISRTIAGWLTPMSLLIATYVPRHIFGGTSYFHI